MIVVSNTSPIIILFYAQKLNILHELFKTVRIPPAVFFELTSQSSSEQLRSTIKKCPYIIVESLDDVELNLEHKLDIGEIEAIKLAKQMNSDILLLDDKRAQKEAAIHSIPYASSFALLVKAKQKGIITNMSETLELLKKHDIYPNKELKEFINFLTD